MYSGVIEGIGPRYCPSIEDKIVRFADKDKHQIFVEPEGLTSYELYPNGISTSLPFDVQLQIVQSIDGFENAHICRPGDAIEYDFFDSRDLKQSLETKFIDGLFFAGQINGTTGYEEAGAQGLIAGMNAALQVQGKDAWTPRRDEAYVGVLIDDLATLGTKGAGTHTPHIYMCVVCVAHGRRGAGTRTSICIYIFIQCVSHMDAEAQVPARRSAYTYIVYICTLPRVRRCIHTHICIYMCVCVRRACAWAQAQLGLCLCTYI